MLKADVNGNEQWRKAFSTKTEFNYTEIITDGGFIICGIDYSNSVKQRDIDIIKIDNLGETLWSKTIGDNYDNTPTSIKPTISGYVLCGYNTNTPTGALGFITTLDANGNLIWTKEYDSNNIQAFDDIINTKDNEFASIGRESFGSISKYYLVKVKSDNGDMIWQKEFNQGEYNSLSELKLTSDDGFIMAGYSLNSGNGNGYLIKTDKEGN